MHIYYIIMTFINIMHVPTMTQFILQHHYCVINSAVFADL